MGSLTEVEGKMNAAQYVDILENNLLPSMEESEISLEDVIFQQDNDPKHAPKKAKEWMEENNITLLDWPPQSPDLNPTEHLWHFMKNELCQYEHRPKVFGRYGTELQRCGER